MKSQVNVFRAYLKLIIKEWAFWAFLILDILGFIINLSGEDFKIPAIFFWCIAFLCVVWAGYRVYLGVLPKTGYQLLKPEIQLGFMEGNEYSYFIHPHPPGKPDRNLLFPPSSLTINLRIQNKSVATRILLIEGFFNKLIIKPGESDLVYVFGTLTAQDLSYPINLKPYEIIICELQTTLRIDSQFTDVQFAARLAEIPTTKTINPVATIKVETQDVSTGAIVNFDVKKEISIRPLKDIYLTYWQQTNNDKLLDIVNTHAPIVDS